MATRELVIRYSMYVIGKTESNHTWNSVPAFDGVSNIISIGMMQNAGSHAQTLLKIIHDTYPDQWSVIEDGAPRLANDVLNLPNDWNTWSSYSLTDSERVVVAKVLDTDEGRAAQVTKWEQDAGNYIDVAISKGMSLDYPKQMIYFMSMYHQSPQSGLNVIAQATSQATLLYLHQTCLNHSILGNYKNRYNETYNLLNAWDGESEPPDFGQDIEIDVGTGQTPGASQEGSPVSRIQAAGDTLVIYGLDGYENGIVCYKTHGNIWLPSENGSGSPEPDEDFNPSPGTGTGAEDVVAKYISWEGKFEYSQAAGRDDPERTGYGDCSSTIWRAYYDVLGINVGTWTGDQATKGRSIAKGSGSLPESQMELGDLVLINWSYNNPSYDHVELYVGNNQLSGHGSGRGPTRKTDMQAYISATYNWEVRRYV